MSRTCVKRPVTFKFAQWDGTNIDELRELVYEAKGNVYFDYYESWEKGFYDGYIQRRDREDVYVSRWAIVVVNSKGKFEVFETKSDFEEKYEVVGE